MASYQTKLKIGRKLEGVETATASDNQISALLRFDEEDETEDHVSMSIESDAMDVDDVVAVFQLLSERGVLTARQSKTWLHQPKASRERFGDEKTWQGTDIEQKVSMLERGLKVRTGGSNGGDVKARNKQAIVQLSELEEKIDDVKATLQGADETDGNDEPSPPDAL